MKTVSVFYLIGQNVRAKENESVIQSFCLAINRLYMDRYKPYCLISL